MWTCEPLFTIFFSLTFLEKRLGSLREETWGLQDSCELLSVLSSANYPLIPWVPEVFLACRRNFWCWPKADTSSAVGRSHEWRSREVTIKTWQKPETALEKSLGPRVTRLWKTRKIECKTIVSYAVIKLSVLFQNLCDFYALFKPF